MAKAKKRQIEVEVITFEKKDDGVILELTKHETQFLLTVLGKISGRPEYPCRKHCNDIINVLKEQGYSFESSRYFHKVEGHLQCME